MSGTLKISWKPVITKGWEREAVYHMFKAFESPLIVLGTNLKLGSSLSFWKENGISPYIGCVYVATRAVNEIAAFRQRIRGEELIEHEVVHADFTIPFGKEAFTIKHVPFSFEFQKFYQNSQKDFSGATDEDDHWVYMSCYPWGTFTHAVQPSMSIKKDCVPKLVWGKFFEEKGEWQMPFSIQANHALVDGFHVAQLIQKMEQYFSAPEETFK